MSRNRIGNKGAKCLAAVIMVNKSLNELWLSRNNIGSEGVESFSDALMVNNPPLPESVLKLYCA